MNRNRRCAALSCAAGSVARQFSCEPLGRRILLDGDPVLTEDPVLVLVEPIQEYLDITTIDDVEPYLWRSGEETNWNLYGFNGNPPTWQGLADEDGNGFAGDAYGWNFTPVLPNFPNGTPNFILGDGSVAAGHAKFITESVV